VHLSLSQFPVCHFGFSHSHAQRIIKITPRAAMQRCVHLNLSTFQCTASVSTIHSFIHYLCESLADHANAALPTGRSTHTSRAGRVAPICTRGVPHGVHARGGQPSAVGVGHDPSAVRARQLRQLASHRVHAARRKDCCEREGLLCGSGIRVRLHQRRERERSGPSGAVDHLGRKNFVRL
jgi:hypothetical protein